MTTEPHFTRSVCREPRSPHTRAITPVVYNFHGGSQQLLRQLSSCSIATTSITSAKISLPYTPACSGFQPRQLCCLCVQELSQHQQFPFGNTAQELAGRGANVHHAAQAAWRLYDGAEQGTRGSAHGTVWGHV